MADIFVIGWHKTGTKSMSEALKILGYNSFHWSEDLAKKWYAGRIDYLLDFCKRYDAVTDMPFPLMYKELFNANPNGKFIFTYRSSPEKWASSLIRHIIINNKRRKRFMARVLYGDDSANGSADPSHYIQRYLQHMRNVREFFEGRSNYLEMCFELGSGWPELCQFLDKPIPNKPFPHLKNKNNQ